MTRKKRSLDPEERKLWEHFAVHRDEQTRNILWERYLYIAYATVLRRPLYGTVEFDDAVAACYIALARGLETFDLAKDVQPCTYLTMRCRYALIDYIREADFATRCQRRKESQIERLTVDLAKQPSTEEVYENLGFTSTLQRTVSIETEVRGRGTTKKCTIGDSLATKPRDQSLSACSYILQGLNSRERLIVLLYWVEDMTMKAIAEQLGLTESRVSQQMSNIMARLKTKFRVAA